MDNMKHQHLMNHHYHRLVTISVTMLIPSLTQTNMFHIYITMVINSVLNGHWLIGLHSIQWQDDWVNEVERI